MYVYDSYVTLWVYIATHPSDKHSKIIGNQFEFALFCLLYSLFYKGLFTLFNRISTFVDYPKPKPSL